MYVRTSRYFIRTVPVVSKSPPYSTAFFLNSTVLRPVGRTVSVVLLICCKLWFLPSRKRTQHVLCHCDLLDTAPFPIQPAWTKELGRCLCMRFAAESIKSKDQIMFQLFRCSWLSDLGNSAMHIKCMALEGHHIFKAYLTKATVHTPANRVHSTFLLHGRMYRHIAPHQTSCYQVFFIVFQSVGFTYTTQSDTFTLWPN